MDDILNKLAKEIHNDNVEKGFYDSYREIGTLLMLIVSELSEALEAYRENKHCNINDISDHYDVSIFKEFVKDTFEDEIADTFIRLLDLCGYLNIDIAEHIRAKLAYNKNREHRHGGKLI